MSGNETEARVRAELVAYAKKMSAAGLVAATAGNVSVRVPGADDRVAVTPSGVVYDEMRPEQVVIVDLHGHVIDSPAGEKPSYETPLHCAILRARPDAGAVFHTHAPNVSALSVLRKPLVPVMDEMVVYLGGTVEVAEYAFSGTDDLAKNAVAGLGDRAGVMLANHGNICVGRDLAEAFKVAQVMEAGARIYLDALKAGTPVELPSDAIAHGRAMYEARKG
ncbi:MAG: class II aldolase/adducin family protein [Deltaproteobacteria bacterium]|nr:class II aldolase/adducin family protein [Deltaproteobacteria bacterium]